MAANVVHRTRSSWLALGLVTGALVGLLWGCGGPGGSPAVVVYTSQDQVYSQQVFEQFQDETGIRVRAVYDSEAVKTVGLANRLLAERERPQADVFWNNEELRTRQLAARQVFEDAVPWRSFGFRTRRLVINTNRLSLSEVPDGLHGLTNQAFRGRVAMAYPMFGTTATHFLALRQWWGEGVWVQWCRALIENEPMMVDGNSVVVRLVGQGEAAIGLTDIDDIRAGQRQGYPIVELPLDRDLLWIPNTVALVRGCRRPELAAQFMDFVTSRAVIDRLVTFGALEGVDGRDGAAGARGLTADDWDAVLNELDGATEQLRTLFLR